MRRTNKLKDLGPASSESFSFWVHLSRSYPAGNKEVCSVILFLSIIGEVRLLKNGMVFVDMPVDELLKYELNAIADSVFSMALEGMPESPIDKCLTFISFVRTYDYWSFFHNYLPEGRRLKDWDIAVIRYAWPFVVRNLYLDTLKCEGFPLVDWTAERQSRALNYLYYIGCGTLIKRISRQYSVGFLNIRKEKNEWTINAAPGSELQRLDVYDSMFIRNIEHESVEVRKKIFNKWNHIVNQDLAELLSKYENGMQINTNAPPPYDSNKINDMMKNGVLLYPVSFGNLIRYHAEDEVIIYVLSIATNKAKRWMHDAGFDTSFTFNGISFLDILAVVSIVTAMNMRHSMYLHHALGRKDINIPCSITIWSSLDDIYDEVNLIISMDKKTLHEILDILSLNEKTFDSILNNENYYMPPLIEIGSSIYIRAIASLTTNPFFWIRKYLFDTNKKEYSKIMSNREKQFREDLYYMFKGNRYKCSDDNIKIKDQSGNILTDIDAAIFDVMDNSLALFQLKWQDFDTNDTLALLSKSKNLVTEIENWGRKLVTWLQSVDINQIKRTFRIKSKTSQILVYLFVISRGFSKIESFGFSCKVDNLAIANFAYFQRVRGELGPKQRTFPMMHQRLKKARPEINQITSSPMSFSVHDNVFNLERYYFGMPDGLDLD